MRGVLLIAVISGCSATPAPVAPQPSSVAQPAQPEEPAETLWDRGTFVTVERDLVLPDIEERFEIYRRADGYRITVKWKRPSPMGDPSDGDIVLFTDTRFSPVQGKMVTNIRMASRTDVIRSTIQREPDGRLTTEIRADGTDKIERTQSAGPNDWYIGGTVTTFLVALCQADASVTKPMVYPDKVTTLGPFKPLPIEGTDRNVSQRILEYEKSGRRVITACEDGKLAGEVTRGVAIVRSGDLALARVLTKWFR